MKCSLPASNLPADTPNQRAQHTHCPQRDRGRQSAKQQCERLLRIDPQRRVVRLIHAPAAMPWHVSQAIDLIDVPALEDPLSSPFEQEVARRTLGIRLVVSD